MLDVVEYVADPFTGRHRPAAFVGKLEHRFLGIPDCIGLSFLAELEEARTLDRSLQHSLDPEVLYLAEQDAQSAPFARLDGARPVADVELSQLPNLFGLPARSVLLDCLGELFRRVEPPRGQPRLDLDDLVQERLQPRIALLVDVRTLLVDQTILAVLGRVFELVDGVVAEVPPEDSDVKICVVDLLLVCLLDPLRARPGIFLEHPALHVEVAQSGLYGRAFRCELPHARADEYAEAFVDHGRLPAAAWRQSV